MALIRRLRLHARLLFSKRACIVCRHDNDQQDFREIRLAPTQGELLAEYEPKLQPNVPGIVASRFGGPILCHFDRHFGY